MGSCCRRGWWEARLSVEPCGFLSCSPGAPYSPVTSCNSNTSISATAAKVAGHHHNQVNIYDFIYYTGNFLHYIILVNWTWVPVSNPSVKKILQRYREMLYTIVRNECYNITCMLYHYKWYNFFFLCVCIVVWLLRWWPCLVSTCVVMWLWIWRV